MTLVSPSGFLRCGIICALAAIQSGCALWKPPSHSQVLTNALPEGTTIPPRWTAGGNRKEVSNDWLRSFHDPGLNAVVAEAIRNNLDLRRAAAQVEIARQNVALVAANMKPQVGLDLNYSGLRDDVRGHNHWYDSKKGLAGVAWEADVWGKLRSQTAAAEAGYEATALDYAFARQSLAATTAKSWYLTVETSQLVALYEESVKIYSDLLALVKTKRNLGKVSDLDVVEASANLNSAQSSLRASAGLGQRGAPRTGGACGSLSRGGIESGPEFRGGSTARPRRSAVVIARPTTGRRRRRAFGAGRVSRAGSGETGPVAQFLADDWRAAS